MKNLTKRLLTLWRKFIMKSNKKYIALIIISFVILSTTIYYFLCASNNMLVLTYHKIVSKEVKEAYYSDNKWIDTTEHFEQQMNYLYEHKYKTISMQEYKNWRKINKKYSSKTVVITFDDGDLGIYYEILPILKKYNFKATCFVIGEHVQEKAPQYDPTKQQFLGMDLINKMKSEFPNIEFQSHSYGLHRNTSDLRPIVDGLNYEEIEYDFKRMNELKIGNNVFSYPYGQENEKIKKALKNNGYDMAFTLDKSRLSNKKDDKYFIPRVSINYETTFNEFKKWLLKAIIKW